MFAWMYFLLDSIDWLNCWLARFVQVLNMKIINDLLSVHKFVIISVVSIEIIVIVISFDSILKSSSISTRIQYIIDFSLVFVVYHYWTWEFILLTRQEIVDGRAKQIRMKYIMNVTSVLSLLLRRVFFERA